MTTLNAFINIRMNALLTLSVVNMRSTIIREIRIQGLSSVGSSYRYYRLRSFGTFLRLFGFIFCVRWLAKSHTARICTRTPLSAVFGTRVIDCIIPRCGTDKKRSLNRLQMRGPLRDRTSPLSVDGPQPSYLCTSYSCITRKRTVLGWKKLIGASILYKKNSIANFLHVLYDAELIKISFRCERSAFV